LSIHVYICIYLDIGQFASKSDMPLKSDIFAD